MPGRPIAVGQADGRLYEMTRAELIDLATPPGTVVLYAGPGSPAGAWLECGGGAASRASYPDLYAALTSVQAGGTTSGSVTVTGLTSTAHLRVGAAVEGTGIQAGTTVATIASGTSVTLSLQATATGTPSLRFFPHGNGDGSSSFTLPDYRGRSPVGAGNNVPLSDRRLGQTFGAETHTLSTAELASHSHTMIGTHIREVGSGGTVTVNGGSNWGASIGTNTSGSGSAHNNMQPSFAVRYFIKT